MKGKRKVYALDLWPVERSRLRKGPPLGSMLTVTALIFLRILNKRPQIFILNLGFKFQVLPILEQLL